eukprot:8048664-Pyramimonas_sp.AAC.1
MEQSLSGPKYPVCGAPSVGRDAPFVHIASRKCRVYTQLTAGECYRVPVLSTELDLEGVDGGRGVSVEQLRICDSCDHVKGDTSTVPRTDWIARRATITVCIASTGRNHSERNNGTMKQQYHAFSETGSSAKFFWSYCTAVKGVSIVLQKGFFTSLTSPVSP